MTKNVPWTTFFTFSARFFTWRWVKIIFKFKQNSVYSSINITIGYLKKTEKIEKILKWNNLTALNHNVRCPAFPSYGNKALHTWMLSIEILNVNCIYYCISNRIYNYQYKFLHRYPDKIYLCMYNKKIL